EELVELQQLRKVLFKLWDTHLKVLKKIKPTNESLSDYFNASRKRMRYCKDFRASMRAWMEKEKWFSPSLNRSISRRARAPALRRKRRIQSNRKARWIIYWINSKE